MKRVLSSILIISFICVFVSCKSTKIAAPMVPDGYDGIYVVKIWKGDNSVLPKNITGLVFKRTGKSYDIILSNVDIKTKTAEEIESLKYKYSKGQFLIKFGGIMKLRATENGLTGSLNHSGKPAKLYLKKIK